MTRNYITALSDSHPCLPFAQSEVKQKAEVAAYFKRFEEAERMYLDMDRRSVENETCITGKWAYVYGIGQTPFVAETNRICTVRTTFQSVVGPLGMF